MTDMPAPEPRSPDLRSSKSAARGNVLDRTFLAHPRAVNETYWEHFLVAGGFGLALLGASLAAFAHALVPAACERTASNTIKRLHARMTARN